MDESAAWRARATQHITEAQGVKESWRTAYRYIRAKRGREASDLFLSEHANKKIKCPACSVIETPKLTIKEFAGGAHIGATCPSCGKWSKWLRQCVPRV
ncbi:MAG: hypothetical protein V4563_05040 [Pseudomonadota bacterium]